MSGPSGSTRRRYAHSAPRRREPVFAITAGLVVVALCVPVAWRALSSDSDHRAAPRNVTSTSSTPSTAPRSTTAPVAGAPTTVPSASTDRIPPAAPGIRIQVVPAVRDVQIRVGSNLYTSTSDGIVDVPDARGAVRVTYIGYSVTPALQQVIFRSWSDGSTAPIRDLDANGRGHVSLAVDVGYRVTIKVAGAPGSNATTLTARSPAGSSQFTDGTRRWVLAERGERSGSDVVARTISYSFDPPRGALPGQRQQFTAQPEGLWTVRAP